MKSSFFTKLLVSLMLLILIVISKAQYIDEVRNNTKQIQQTPATEDYNRFIRGPQFSDKFTKPIIVFFVVFVAMASLVVNSLIIHVIRVNQHMRNTTNYFIVNMASGDLLATIGAVPLSIKYLYNGMEWSSGTTGMMTCKMTHFAIFVAFLCSIFSLVAITFDRFMAVSRPLKYKYCSSWTKYILPAVWIASLALPSRLAFSKMKIRNYFNKTYCSPSEFSDDSIMIISVGCLLPHVAMVILYSLIAYKLWTRRVPGEQRNPQRQHNAHQTAKRVTRMVICVIVVFDLCWFVMFAFSFLLYSNPLFIKLRNNRIMPPFSTIFVNLNGPLNALIYAAFNENFRRAFKNSSAFIKLGAICSCCSKRARENDINLNQRAPNRIDQQ